MIIKKGTCVMCGQPPELRIDNRTGKEVYIYFIDPKTKEQLCNRHNEVNDKIYREKGISKRGKFKLLKGGSII